MYTATFFAVAISQTKKTSITTTSASGNKNGENHRTSKSKKSGIKLSSNTTKAKRGLIKNKSPPKDRRALIFCS